VSFRRRIALASAAAVAIAVVLASAVVYLVVRDGMRDQVDSGLRELAQGATVTPLPPPPPGSPAAPEGAGGRPRARAEPGLLEAPARAGAGRHARPGRVKLALPPPPFGAPAGTGQVITAAGDVVRAPSQDVALPVSDAARAVAAGQRGPLYEDVTVDGEHLRVLTTPGQRPGEAVQVARSLEETDSTLRHLALVLVLVGIGGILLAAGIGWLVSRAAIAPVERLTRAAEHVTATRDLGSRIATEGRSDELGRLAAAFNAMLAELEWSLRSQRQLVADASHELRTPITSLRTNIEVLARPNGMPEADRERLLRDVVAQLGELSALVGGLVDLARDEEPVAELEPLRLDELVTAAVERARRNFPGVRFDTRLEPCTVHGTPERLERAVSNLLDNAAKWSPGGGEVEVETTAGVVSVRDHGPGIAPEDLPHVFDRFYRAPAARGLPGSGLGLAIVRQVAQAHGGSVAAGPAPGGGTVVRLELPLVDSVTTRVLAKSSEPLS
jgi:two-component system sensor histidine kinase MprB